MKKILTYNQDQTKKLAFELAQSYKIRGGVITLFGGLGTGKTTFVQGFAQGLGITGRVLSPTFVLSRIHPVPKSNLVLYHVDLYRLESVTDLNELGLGDLFFDPQAIVLIEWADRLGKLIPKKALQVKLRNLGKNKRQVEII